jgi:hypothetical protein
MNRLAGITDGGRNLLRLIIPRTYHPKRNAFCRARSNARHLSQLRNQIPERGRIFGLSQNEREGLVGWQLREVQRERLQPAQIEL